MTTKTILLHKTVAEQGLDKLLDKVKHLCKLSQAPAFKPVRLPVKPHPYWYLLRNEKRITELAVIATTAITVIVLLIKNWG